MNFTILQLHNAYLSTSHAIHMPTKTIIAPSKNHVLAAHNRIVVVDGVIDHGSHLICRNTIASCLNRQTKLRLQHFLRW